MYIEAPKNTINKSAKEVFEFLTDLQNFKKLMPENIEKFEVINEANDGKSCSQLNDILCIIYYMVYQQYQ